jgi:hypothetical protein
MVSDLQVKDIETWSCCCTGKNLDRPYLSVYVRILEKFCHDLPRNLNTKLAINELSFLLVTLTTLSDERFDSYGLLKTEHGDELF